MQNAEEEGNSEPQVKKPASVEKLGSFIKSRPETFKIVGDQVELTNKE